MSKRKRAKVDQLLAFFWDDASANAAWNSDRKALPLAPAVTSGYLLHASKSRVVVGASHVRTPGSQFGERITIPRGTIRSIRRLRIGGSRRKPKR